MKCITEYINEAKNKSAEIAQALADYVGCDVENVKVDGNQAFIGDAEYQLFKSEKAAYNYVLKEYGPDYCNGATENSTWYNMIMKACDGDEKVMKKCFPHGKDGEPNFKAITKEVLDSEGVEWFLAGYDGQQMDLDNGMVAYRYN